LRNFAFFALLAVIKRLHNKNYLAHASPHAGTPDCGRSVRRLCRRKVLQRLWNESWRITGLPPRSARWA